MLGRLLYSVRPLTRAFTSHTEALQGLKRVLTSEFDHERKEYVPDEGLQTFLDRAGFSLHESPKTVEVTLKKTLGNSEVVVTFLARPPETPPSEEETAMQQQGDENNESWVDFQASISSGAKGLIYECSATKGEIAVNNIVVTGDVSRTDRVSTFLNTQKEYRGPDFDGLDESLQKAFMEYLNASGVDEELATFIENFSLDKEQRLYMDWLAKVKSLL